MKLSSRLGIIALILTAISFLIPFFGFLMTWLALVIAAVAALKGDKGLTIATIVLSSVKLVISPTLWMIPFIFVPNFILLILPICGMVIYVSERRETAQTE